MEEIYKEYSKIVYGYLISLTNNEDIAKELTQETFYSAIKNIKKFRNDSNIKTWLCKIAKNKFIDYYKKNKKIKEVSIEEYNIKNNDALLEKPLEEHFEEKEEVINIYQKIHKLDNCSKEVFLLRLRGELSYKEIGMIMGKSEQWARITFYRAKIKIREELENEKK